MEKQQNIKQKLPDKFSNFSEWYQQLILRSGLADYSSVSGCIVYRPLAYAIWEKIMQEVDKRFKQLGIKNCYFPLFIPEKLFEKEAEHIAGFKPEVAWVTHAGDTKLAERLAVRPTSEAIMYASYSKWIRSWRDLPLKLNQWNNVVRWEFKHPVPFLRGREFLWNEGHNAYATEKEAMEDLWKILNIYKDVCENILALYGIVGKKTELEKFAGAVSSYAIEFLLPNGKAAQGPDAHFDGENFAKAYDICFLDQQQQKRYVQQITYAISTRMIGVMVAIHSDNHGLVLPPKVAPTKIVIIPIFDKQTKQNVLDYAKQVKSELVKLLSNSDSDAIIIDDREQYTPGYKFNEYELKGVPVRIEIGMRDIEQESVTVFRRDTLERFTIKLSQLSKIKELLDEIQKNLFEKAKQFLLSNVVTVNNIDELKQAIANKKMAKANFCCTKECEQNIAEQLEAITPRVIALDEKPNENDKCIFCGKKAQAVVYFARSY